MAGHDGLVPVQAPALATVAGEGAPSLPVRPMAAEEEDATPGVPDTGAVATRRPRLVPGVASGGGRLPLAPSRQGPTDLVPGPYLPDVVVAGAVQVARRRYLDGHGAPVVPGIPAAEAVVPRVATAPVTEPVIHGLLVAPSPRPVVLPTAEDDPLGKAALVVVQTARPRRLILALGAQNTLPSSRVARVHDPRPAGLARARDAGGPTRHLPAMAVAATPAALVHGPGVGLRLLTLQTTPAIVRSLDLRPAILPVPTLERATNVVGRLILEEGASGQARPHEVVEGAKGIPGPAMA